MEHSPRARKKLFEVLDGDRHTALAIENHGVCSNHSASRITGHREIPECHSGRCHTLSPARFWAVIAFAGACPLAGGARAPSAIFVVRLDDALHQAVADHIALVEIDHRDTLNIANDLNGFHETGAAVA